MKLIMLVIIIGLAVTSFYEHGKATDAEAARVLATQMAENNASMISGVRDETNAAQKQIEDTARQLAEAKEAAKILTEAQAVAQKEMAEKAEETTKKLAEMDEVKKKLTDAEAQLATMQTELATAKAQAAATKDELTKLQEKTKLPPLGTTPARRPGF